MPKSGGDKQNDKNSEHNHSDFSPRNYLHILYHSLRLDNGMGRGSSPEVNEKWEISGKDQVNMAILKAGGETIAKEQATPNNKCITERRISSGWN